MPATLEDALDQTLAKWEDSRLKEACSYALLHGGKKLRIKLVQTVANCLGQGRDVEKAGLAVEFFHTASLAADDLPCMDDEDERRARPSLHKVYGETLAILVSYALIAEGYGLLRECAKDNIDSGKLLPSEGASLCFLALEQAAFNTGVLGATGGQYLDLFEASENLDKARLLEVIEKKTSSLFELSFVLGWLYGGGDPKQQALAAKAGRHYGNAYQIYDDILDLKSDQERGCLVNYALAFGLDEAKHQYALEKEAFFQALDNLKLQRAAFLPYFFT